MSSDFPVVTIEGGDYEHTLVLSSRRNGCELDYRVTDIPALYRRVLGGDPIEICEFSLSNLMMMYDRGRADLVALPVFPNRAFRHGCLLVRKESSITSPRQLQGKRVGVVDYSMTAAVWTRALLREEFDLSWRDVSWVSSGEPRFPAPDAVRMSRVNGDLEELLERGEIDALIHPHSKDAMRRQSERRFRALIEDHVASEKAYYRTTGFYPINHVLIASRAVLQSIPGAARAAFEAYVHAKRSALKRRIGTTFMPWADVNWRDALETFGDPYPYGWTIANQGAVNAVASHLLEQQLLSRPADIAKIFLDGTADWQEREVV